MKIQAEPITDGYRIKIGGRLDTMTAPQMEEFMNNRLKECKILILDLKDLEYISSAGLRVFLALQKTMNKQGKMEIHNVNEVNKEVFEMTGFSDILTII